MTEEEELTTGSRERGPRTRIGRLRLDLLVAAVILGAVIVVGRAMSHGGGSAAPAPSPTPSPSESIGKAGSGASHPGSGLLTVPTTVVTVQASSGRIILLPRLPSVAGSGTDDPAACPAGIGCFTVDSAPAPALAAIRAAFPDLVVEAATTVRLDVKNYGQALWFLQVNARAGPKQILLRLQQQRMSDVNRHDVIRSGGEVITSYGHSLLQYYVYVQVDAPGRRAEPLAGLQNLAGDVRLLDRG